MPCQPALPPDEAGREDHVYEFSPQISERWFGLGRFGRLGTIGDGSCFFHSVCYAINADGYTTASRARRQQIAYKMRCAFARKFAERDYDRITAGTVTTYKKPFKAVKKLMCNPKAWADEVMIKFASTILGLNIVFMNLYHGANTMYCGVHSPQALAEAQAHQKTSEPSVIIAWVNQSHFELVVRIDDIGPVHTRVRTCFDSNVHADFQVINHLMSAYSNKCHIK